MGAVGGRWIECVPNFSEGRDERVVREIARSVRAAGGAVLDLHMDADHNRSVITFAAPLSGVVEAAYRGVERAVALIDLGAHEGVHPRVGAADVVPFVPLRDGDRESAVLAARELGGRLAEGLGLPVYLYGWAAAREEHRALPDVRREFFAAVAASAAGPISPDLGPDRPHPTAGAVVVGARPPLVALNCWIEPDDAGLARRIAAHTRERGGGPAGVRALGLWLEGAGRAQVSMNITDADVSPPHAVVEHARARARAEGVRVSGSELVGLLPLRSVLAAAAHALGLPELRAGQVLELAIRQKQEDVLNSVPLDTFLDDLAGSAPAPGGGAASALVGALAAALTSMVCNLTVGRAKYADADERLRAALDESERLRARLRGLMEADEAAYSDLMAQYKLPKDMPEQQAARAGRIEAALQTAADVPLESAGACLEVLRLLGDIGSMGNRTVISDAGAAALMAEAAARASLLNVRVNAGLMKDEERAATYLERMEAAEREARELARSVLATVTDRMG